jgi:hypothetical protein
LLLWFSLDCPFLIAPLVFSNIYLERFHIGLKKIMGKEMKLSAQCNLLSNVLCYMN